MLKSAGGLPKVRGSSARSLGNTVTWFCAVREANQLIALNRGALPLGTT